MEFKDHGPVYVLHRVFRLNEESWPRLDADEHESDTGAADPTHLGETTRANQGN
jgi:hypothetical protein